MCHEGEGGRAGEGRGWVEVSQQLAAKIQFVSSSAQTVSEMLQETNDDDDDKESTEEPVWFVGIHRYFYILL